MDKTDIEKTGEGPVRVNRKDIMNGFNFEFGTRNDAVEFTKIFWTHYSPLTARHLATGKWKPELHSQLIYGDRTDMFPDPRGSDKWSISITGNGGPVTTRCKEVLTELSYL
ncbi:MAG: hypothetical protein A2542_01860 [Parcubacteria group bacterium RIFOXYD2_FULL_52_8]|nr:MAG: hypothetical protein A2542_01860 [Parcubacteria group bacterium RIFOXYD2_FULL_52_8]